MQFSANKARIKIHLIVSCFLSLFIVTCSDDDSPAINGQAKDFLDEVLTIMENNSLHKKEIDWTEFKTKVFNTVGAAQTIEDTYPGIREALVMLGDNHSSFLKPDGSGIFVGTLQCQGQSIGVPVLPEHIGYVKINSFSGSTAEATAYAKTIQQQIKNQDHPDMKGWIIDLRSNGGGNMWPMLAGVGPILGEGISGYFINADGVESPWSYDDGASKASGNIITQVVDWHELITPDPKVAVLLDKGIASSGEVIAISFIGRANTKSFGSSTCGLSTANSVYNLSHNCRLILTVADLADRSKKKYGVPINPDQASTVQTIIEDAVEWIEN